LYIFGRIYPFSDAIWMLRRPSGVSTSNELNGTSNGNGSPTIFQLMKFEPPVPEPVPRSGITKYLSKRAWPVVRIGLADSVSLQKASPTGFFAVGSPSWCGIMSVLNEEPGSLGPNDV